MHCCLQSLLEHMKHEEDELLPQFMATEGVTDEYLMQLGRLFEDSKLISPSRYCLVTLYCMSIAMLSTAY